jgi:WD40 repeat protein
MGYNSTLQTNPRLKAIEYTSTGHQNSVRAIALSVDEQCLYAGDSDGIIREWNLTDGIYDRTFVGYPSFVRTIGIRTFNLDRCSVIAIAVSADGQFLYTSSTNIIRELNLTNGICERIFSGHQAWVKAIALSTDGQWLYSGGVDRIIKEWNIKDGSCKRNFPGHQRSVIAIAISDDGQLFYSGSDDGIIKEWSLIDGSCQSTFKAHQGVMFEMAISANGKMLYTCGKDLTIEEFDVVTGQCLRTIDPRLCAGANITNVKGLTPAQTDALLALGAISDVGWEDVQIDDGCISIDYRPQMNLGLRAKVH